MSERYRPSNGTEGQIFMAQWCERCVKDSPSHPCSIIGRTMSLDSGDPKYPREWTYDMSGPVCTAFSDHVKPRPTTVRDKRQIGLPI